MQILINIWRRKAGAYWIVKYSIWRTIAKPDRNLNKLTPVSLTACRRKQNVNSNEVADYKFLKMTSKFSHIEEILFDKLQFENNLINCSNNKKQHGLLK